MNNPAYIQDLLEKHAKQIDRLNSFEYVAPGGGTADATYLRITTTNAPLTGALPITVNSAVALDVKTAGGTSVFKVNTISPAATVTGDLVHTDSVSGFALTRSIFADGVGVLREWMTASGGATDQRSTLSLIPKGVGLTGVASAIELFVDATSNRYFEMRAGSGGNILISRATAPSVALPMQFAVGLTDTPPTIATLDNASSVASLTVSGQAATADYTYLLINANTGKEALLGFQVGGVAKWSIYVPTGSTNLRIFDNANTTDVVTIATGGATTFSSTVQATQLISTIAIGTAPLTVTSTTVVTNLNADTADGMHFSGTGFTLTVPATGTAAMLNAANSFTLINPLTTITESWIGPSSTTGIYFKTSNVGIGGAPSAASTFAVTGASGDHTQTEWYASYSATSWTPTNDVGKNYYTANYALNVFDTNATGDLTAQYFGARFSVNVRSAAKNLTNSTSVIGGYFFPWNIGRTGTSGTITAIVAGKFLIQSDLGTVTTAINVNAAGVIGVGTYTNVYGILIGAITQGATLNYSIYGNAGLYRFGDQLAIAGSADRQQLLVTGYTTQAVGTSLVKFVRNDTAAGVSRLLSLVGLGSGADGDGVKLRMSAKDSTSADMDQFDIQSLWATSPAGGATHLSRKALVTLSIWDTAAREFMRAQSNGSAAMLGFYGGAAVARGTALTTQLTTITHTAPGTPDYAIQDFAQNGGAGIWGFADHDEANSVLKVIANLQTRCAELEARLGSATGVNLFA